MGFINVERLESSSGGEAVGLEQLGPWSPPRPGIPPAWGQRLQRLDDGGPAGVRSRCHGRLEMSARPLRGRSGRAAARQTRRSDDDGPGAREISGGVPVIVAYGSGPGDGDGAGRRPWAAVKRRREGVPRRDHGPGASTATTAPAREDVPRGVPARGGRWPTAEMWAIRVMVGDLHAGRLVDVQGADTGQALPKGSW